MLSISNIIERALDRFNLLPDKEDEQTIIAQISKGITFRGANLWVLIFAIFIASLGLNVNSTAVIIGAMLISPLMGPIIGMGLAVGINDLDLLKRSAKNYGVATLISVITATLYFLISPLGEAQSELLARTSPTLYDVLIAFCGGAAGIIAICTGGKGNAIPGVAIATALMPPLCTAGFGLATGHWLYFLGAFYLFFINTVFIALATYGGVRFLNFQPHEFLTPKQERRAHRILTAIVLVTMIPATFMTVLIVKQEIFESNVRRFVNAQLSQQGTQIISNSVDKATGTLRVVAVGREITEATQAAARKQMGQYGLELFELSVIQGAQTDSLMQLNDQLIRVTTTRENEHKQMLQLTAQNATLEQQLAQYARYEQLPTEMRDELAVLFPQVSTLALAPVAESRLDTAAVTSYVAAIISTSNNTPLTPDDSNRLRLWLQTRSKSDSLIIVETTQPKH